MARFIEVKVRCDWDGCDTIAPEGEGTVRPRTMALDGKQPKEFQLCEKHSTALNDVVLPLMQAGIKVENSNSKKGRQAPAAAASPNAAGAGERSAGNGHPRETFECQVDECGRTLHNRTGMAQHVIRTHGFDSLAAYELQYPNPA